MKKCNVKGCDKKSVPSYQLHKIPDKRVRKRRRRWIDVLRINNSAATNNFRVCSFHFKETDFLPSAIQRPKSILNATAIPSQRLPGGVDQRLILLREQNNRNRELRAINRRIAEEEQEDIFIDESDDEEIIMSLEDLASEVEEVAYLLEEAQMIINMILRKNLCLEQIEKKMTQQIINVHVEMRRRFDMICEKRARMLSLLHDERANILRQRINHF